MPPTRRAVLQALQGALGADAVRVDPETVRSYARDTSAYEQRCIAVLLPRSLEDVQCIVRIASTHRVALHPISTGRNWGYGTANPPREGCAIVDLSCMRRIQVFDAELGLMTLEPGVTQGALRAWLDTHGFPFMVPTTGAGPGCSIVGNALERGYGITPLGDHFGALTALEAVLPDGSVYRSPMAELGGFSGFKWGVGPYLDGVFSQGQAGIVTSVTVALARRPARVEAFYFWINTDHRLEAAVNATRRLLQKAGSNIGGINLMSAARVLAMSGRCPDGYTSSGPPLTEPEIERLALQTGATAWMGVGAIYGTRPHAAATRALIRRELRGIAGRTVFMTSARARRLDTLLGWVPGVRATRSRAALSIMRQGLALLEGVPSEVALPLAYWKASTPPEHNLHPSRDGCGLLWYAPIVPMKSADVRCFVDLAREVCTQYGFEAPITLTSLSERCFDCTLPLLFDRADMSACKRAEACWDALFELGHRAGFLPYRLHMRTAKSAVAEDSPYWRLATQIKAALDPLDLLSPGRWPSNVHAQHPYAGNAHTELHDVSSTT